MSQKAILVRVSGNLIPEVFTHVPEYDDMLDICKDHGYDGTESISDHYLVEYEWIEIGDGESDADEFIDEETLLAIYDSYDYEKHIYETFGYDVELIESGSEEVMFYDLQED